MKMHNRSIEEIIEKHDEDNKREAIRNNETLRFIGLIIMSAALLMILFYINGS